MNDEKTMTRIVRCPRCRKAARYDAENLHRPFCSARCKNEDIVSWAQEDYKISSKPSSDEEESVPNSSQTPTHEEDDV